MEGYGNENPGAFQPTRPLRGATTVCFRFLLRWRLFQPTRPLRGATTRTKGKSLDNTDFNPRAPCGARLRHNKPFNLRQNFNPRAPCGARPEDVLRPIYTVVISTHAPLAGRDSKSVQITMHIFAITDKFQMLLHRMPPVRAFCSFLMQENHADFGCEPPK